MFILTIQGRCIFLPDGIYLKWCIITQQLLEVLKAYTSMVYYIIFIEPMHFCNFHCDVNVHKVVLFRKKVVESIMRAERGLVVIYQMFANRLACTKLKSS